MAKGLNFSYDKEGDVLDISVGEPSEAISQELEDDFFIRRAPDSNEILGFSILNFEKWFKGKRDTKTLPVEAVFNLITQ